MIQVLYKSVSITVIDLSNVYCVFWDVKERFGYFGLEDSVNCSWDWDGMVEGDADDGVDGLGDMCKRDKERVLL